MSSLPDSTLKLSECVSSLLEKVDIMATIAAGSSGEDQVFPTTRRRFLALAGAGLVGSLAGCGSGSASARIQEVLTEGQGVWYQHEFGQGVTIGPGIPANRTEASWRFERQDGLRDDLEGIGTRLTRLVLPNGTTGRWSTPGLGTNFTWRLDGDRLVAFFQGFSLTPREESGTLRYDSQRDECTIRSDVWGNTTWVRWERAFERNTDFGGNPDVGSFTRVSGPQNAFSVEIPTTWDDIRQEQVEGALLLTAAPRGTVLGQPPNPGVAVYVFTEPDLDPSAILEQADVQIRNCFRTGVQQFSNASGLSGFVHRYDGCGGTSASRINFAATRPDNQALLFGSIWTRNVTDGTTAQRVLDSLALAL